MENLLVNDLKSFTNGGFKKEFSIKYGFLTKIDKKYNFSFTTKGKVCLKYSDRFQTDNNFISEIDKYYQNNINNININNLSKVDFLPNESKFYLFYLIFESDGLQIVIDRNLVKLRIIDKNALNQAYNFDEKTMSNLTDFKKFSKNLEGYWIVELKQYFENEPDNNDLNSASSNRINSANKIKNICWFLIDTHDEELLRDFFGYLKYNIYFSKESMANYFQNYCHSVIEQFSTPSYDLYEFYKNIGYLNVDNNENTVRDEVYK